MPVIDPTGPSLNPMRFTWFEPWTNQRFNRVTPIERQNIYDHINRMYDAALTHRPQRFNVTRCPQAAVDNN